MRFEHRQRTGGPAVVGCYPDCLGCAVREAIEKAIAAERERCAKIAEEFAPYAACHKIAKRIRES